MSYLCSFGNEKNIRKNALTFDIDFNQLTKQFYKKSVKETSLRFFCSKLYKTVQHTENTEMKVNFMLMDRENGNDIRKNRDTHTNTRVKARRRIARFDESPAASEEVKFVIPSAAKPSDILFMIYKNIAGSSVDRNVMWSWAKHSNSKKYDCANFG